MKPRRALLSVSDKTGIVELARALVEQGVELLSTGGTARLLAGEGLPVVEVADYTGFPEIMEGRVKTLHPRIHGGLLGRRDVDEGVMQDHGIGPIDLLVVNLYPFQRTVARPDCDLATAIEHIDVGGPAMIRAAAKNHAWVTVVVDPEDYVCLLEELRAGQGFSADTRFALAAKAFEHTARYDAAIANYLSAHGRVAAGEDFPPHLVLVYDKREDLRYGENPHQRAAFYARHHPPAGSAAAGRQLQGKPLSFNNIADADAALDCVSALEEPACVIVKHANPCGAAQAASLAEAYERAYACDSTSAFGGIIAFNRPLDAVTAERILGRQFVEVIAAPVVEAEALAVLARKPDVRVLEVGQWSARVARELDVRSVTGGVLVQERDLARAPIAIEGLRIVSRRAPTDAEIRDLLFAWRVCACVKSNAIVYARDGQTVGIGAGQMSRVYSARIAAIKAADAGLELEGSVVASDAFFPFRDGVDTAAAAGARALIQPGGSMRDAEVIAAADEHDMAMVFTGVRHFRH